MQLRQWIRMQGETCEDADRNAGEILGIKTRTMRAIRLGKMNPSPKSALMISDKLENVSFRDCFHID